MQLEEKPTAWRPTITRILMMDYGAFLGLLIAVVPFAMLVLSYIGVLGEQSDDDLQFWLFSAFAGVVLGSLTLFLRLRSISSLYERAVEVPGRISKVWFMKDRGRVEYTYSFRGQAYSSGKAIMKNRRTSDLQSGRSVVVIVDPENPRKSLIRDLYG